MQCARGGNVLGQILIFRENFKGAAACVLRSLCHVIKNFRFKKIIASFDVQMHGSIRRSLYGPCLISYFKITSETPRRHLTAHHQQPWLLLSSQWHLSTLEGGYFSWIYHLFQKLRLVLRLELYFYFFPLVICSSACREGGKKTPDKQA